MTDRELLEKAAKAAGVQHADYTFSDYPATNGLQLVDSAGRHTGSWNPLNDDADALRLAVRLGLDVEMHGCVTPHPFACASNCDLDIAEEAQLDSGDPFATTRRAIVQAAAAMAAAP